MDVANASMYDGSTATPEAAMMAVRATGRSGVLVSRAVHPEYREVLRTYARNQGMPVEEFGYDTATGGIDLEDLEKKLTGDTAAVLPSYIEALATSMPVSIVICVWNSNRYCSVPWVISG